MGEWRYSSNFLDLGSRYRRVVSFTPLPLYTPEKEAQTLSGRCGEKKNLKLAGVELRPSSP
jgi:hypothetical protein